MVGQWVVPVDWGWPVGGGGDVVVAHHSSAEYEITGAKLTHMCMKAAQYIFVLFFDSF